MEYFTVKQFSKKWDISERRIINLIKDGRIQDVYGEEFKCGKLTFDKDITEMPLDGTEYQYVFRATDIFGNVYYSDMATMKMKYTYDELLENPLPDRTPAAEVTNIEPFYPEF